MLSKLLALAIYVAVLAAIGYYASRRTRNISDYFAGGKNMGFWAVAFSSRATGESAWLLLGLTGFGAAFGVQGFWIVLGEVLGVSLAWLWLSRRFKQLTDQYDSITVPDFFEAHLKDESQNLRRIAAGALLVFVPIYVSAQIHATGRAVEAFLDWNYYLGALIGFLIVLFYVTRGGFIAVVWSDVFQGTLMFFALVALPIVGVIAGGGVGAVYDRIQADYPLLLDWTGGEGVNSLSIAGIIGLVAIGIGFLGSPQVFVRFIALRSENEIKRGAAVAITWTVFACGGAVLAGMVGRAVLIGDLGSDSENVLPRMAEELMPPFITGLYITIVLSAIMSTIDSLLVVASSAAVRDWYQKIRNPDMSEEQLIRMCRKVTVGLAFVALAVAMGVSLATEGQGVFWFVIFGWSGIAATFCPVVILSLTWRGLNAVGAGAGMIAGFASVPFFKFVGPNIAGIGPYIARVQELAPAFAVSFLAAILFSRFSGPGARA
ncbi:MAG: sodium/proline symporter [Planctomycetota bacterium]|jgi:sodium/proline symporter